MEAPADHWIRAEEITRKVKGEPTNEGRMLLFEGSIDPGDVVQVGSCFPPPTPGFVRPRQWGSAGRCEHCRHMLQHVAPQLRTLWPHGHPAHHLLHSRTTPLHAAPAAATCTARYIRRSWYWLRRTAHARSS